MLKLVCTLIRGIPNLCTGYKPWVLALFLISGVSFGQASSTDVDCDGIDNTIDLDDDNDGIPDAVEAGVDTDTDGIDDSLDLDSGNDGIPDYVEAGGADADNDGVVDGFTDAELMPTLSIWWILMVMGSIVDLFDDDFLGNGFLPFTVQGEAAGTTDLPDTDGDNIPDVLEAEEVEPPAAATPPGKVHTGLAGSGCSINGSGSGKDAMLPMLLLLTIVALCTRRRRGIGKR